MAKACQVVTRSQGTLDGLDELPYFREEWEAQPGKSRKLRAQRRRDKYAGQVRKENAELPKPTSLLDFDFPSDVSILQKEDPSLRPWFEKVTEVEGDKQGQISFMQEDALVVNGGILYQKKGQSKALPLPQQFRHRVMDLRHSVPWAGHMGFQKTLCRICSRFVWLGVYTDVSQFCRSCNKCQLTSRKAAAQAHLQPLPIIETPFERIGMDIVGPLEKSSLGNKYTLVICDYATRYPEAFLLRAIKAKEVANCFLQFFSQVGIAREILTDCGTNFFMNFTCFNFSC